MKKVILLLGVLLWFSKTGIAQKLKTENIVLITTDGFRWQEMFGGVDSLLVFDQNFNKDIVRIDTTFEAKIGEERRKKLLPFFWNTIAKEGQIYGNRWKGNKVDVTNTYWFSYPGYNEILTGFADSNIKSNDKNENKNVTVLEFLNKQSALKDKVAAFSTWDVFPYIINEKRSGIPVNSGVELVSGELSAKEELLNELQKTVPPSGSDRFDFMTYYLAKEYVIKNKPRVLYLAFDETDELAHESKYRDYVFSAHAFDKYVADLWNYYQSQPQYKDKTTFIITTDHGRGNKTPKDWTNHGENIQGSNEIWIAILGPDSPALGELNKEGQLFQNQIAKTLAKFLGYDYKNEKPVGETIKSAFR